MMLVMNVTHYDDFPFL